MERKNFLKLFFSLPIVSSALNLKEFYKETSALSVTELMPVLFLGHGSPMNAIEENEFVAGFRTIGKSIPQPKAILCVSAHWETKGTWVTAMDKPRTIHDFGGFPKALFDVQYLAPGSPQLAKETKALIKTTDVGLDEQWGLDHGAWSVIKHLYPNADIPVIQMSIDYNRDAEYHYTLSKELQSLREKGILIVGSGNMVHNLGMVAWDKLNATDYAYDWAKEANTIMKDFILDDNHQALIDFRKQGKPFDLSIPTPEHYLPLLYALALKRKNEPIKIFNDKAVGGSLTMTSIKIG
jgi:4,5-DOPA dioxygenase extradiol